MGKYVEIRPGVYREEGFFAPAKKEIPDDEYYRQRATHPSYCADVALWHRYPENGHIYLDLALRTIVPALHEWWIYGGGLEMGELPEEAALRHLLADTGLVAGVEDLALLDPRPRIYMWKNGKGGYFNQAHADVFALEINHQNLALADEHLRATEYNTRLGIRPFDGKVVLGVPGGYEVHPAMLWVYNRINELFGQR